MRISDILNSQKSEQVDNITVEECMMSSTGESLYLYDEESPERKIGISFPSTLQKHVLIGLNSYVKIPVFVKEVRGNIHYSEELEFSIFLLIDEMIFVSSRRGHKQTIRFNTDEIFPVESAFCGRVLHTTELASATKGMGLEVCVRGYLVGGGDNCMKGNMLLRLLTDAVQNPEQAAAHYAEGKGIPINDNQFVSMLPRLMYPRIGGPCYLEQVVLCCKIATSNGTVEINIVDEFWIKRDVNFIINFKFDDI